MSTHLHRIPLAEFEAAADLARLQRGGRARLGAMLVLVAGEESHAAAARARCSRQAVEAATGKVLRVLRACPLCRRSWSGS